MSISSKDIGTPFIVGLMTNMLSAYLFSLQIIDFNTLIFILVGTLIVILIIGIQLKTRETKEELESQKVVIKQLGEKLKIHEQLIDMKAEIKELQKKVFK